ncbi:MAG: MoxR family ATPase, partial [Myxococcota bacterium]|nr:MoxR family ATPase [Myxococcota bacterium]
SPRTQSALLEAMAERQVTLSGERYTLGPPFQVIATQNPIEFAGTFPLPEAQADRFLFKSLVEIPDEEVLATLVDARPMHHLKSLEACLERGELLRWQTHAATLPIAARLRRWIARLVAQSSPKHAPDSVAPYLSAGVSPRAVQAIADAARARATLYGRLYVEGEDLLAVARPALRHRLQLHWRAQTEMLSREQLVTRLLEAQEQL